MLKNISGQFNKETKEEDLKYVKSVQENCDSESLSFLCERHSALYYNIVKKYCRLDSGNQYYNDLIDSKNSNIYDAVQAFDPEKQMAFSSYLAETIKWKCLSYSTTLSKNKTDPLPEGYMTLEDHSSMNPEEQYEVNELLKEFKDFVSHYQDGRLQEIVRIRFDEQKSLAKLASWKEIGKEIGVSYETARQIYYRAIDQFKKKNDLQYAY